jgi:hypothetical protein
MTTLHSQPHPSVLHARAIIKLEPVQTVAAVQELPVVLPVKSIIFPSQVPPRGMKGCADIGSC